MVSSSPCSGQHEVVLVSDGAPCHTEHTCAQMWLLWGVSSLYRESDPISPHQHIERAWGCYNFDRRCHIPQQQRDSCDQIPLLKFNAEQAVLKSREKRSRYCESSPLVERERGRKGNKGGGQQGTTIINEYTL
jgi:hypothetical protein